MMCPICHEEFQTDDRCQANVLETFIFKPASADDKKMIKKLPDGRIIEVSAAATLSPEALAESRKDHKKTVMATTYFVYGRVPVPEGATSVRHVACVVQKTGALSSGAHPMGKHSIRYSRSMVKRSSR